MMEQLTDLCASLPTVCAPFGIGLGYWFGAGVVIGLFLFAVPFIRKIKAET